MCFPFSLFFFFGSFRFFFMAVFRLPRVHLGVPFLCYVVESPWRRSSSFRRFPVAIRFVLWSPLTPSCKHVTPPCFFFGFGFLLFYTNRPGFKFFPTVFSLAFRPPFLVPIPPSLQIGMKVPHIILVMSLPGFPDFCACLLLVFPPHWSCPPPPHSLLN